MNIRCRSVDVQASTNKLILFSNANADEPDLLFYKESLERKYNLTRHMKLNNISCTKHESVI